jgi:CRISPR system Cascade subunit CasC
MSSARYLDVHVMQSVPFANLNRDDTNSVKTVQWGNVLRTRVSSQCWKRATREHFQERMGEQALRTRRIAARVDRELRSRGWPEGLAERAAAHVAVGSSIKFELAKVDRQLVPNKVLTVINLFGRMLAEVDDAGVDGAVQVAHALTTHATDIELDYFSAVDDVTAAWGDATGSAHMGNAEYSAGTFYRYATVDLRELATNIGPDTTAARELVDGFLHAFIESLPRAKKNSTAVHTAPSLVHLSVRTDRPLSYAAAFEAPVRAATEGGFEAPSIAALADYAAEVNAFLGTGRITAAGWAAPRTHDLSALGDRKPSLDELITFALDAALDAHQGTK